MKALSPDRPTRVGDTVAVGDLADNELSVDRVGDRLAELQSDSPVASAGTPASMAERLRKAGLRPTRQRVALGCLLYARGHRHVSAEMLHEEARQAQFPVSMATVYNTLHQFTETGLLREIAVEGARSYFDTNTSQHHHFFIEGENRLIDIDEEIAVDNIPEPPPGMCVESFQVIVRVRART